MNYSVLSLFVCAFFAACSHSPRLEVNDTDSAKGRLGFRQTVVFSDLVRFHGHPCDGLMEGMQALQLGLSALYPDGVLDRTNTRVVSKSSPCLADAAIYLSGARMQYGSFYVDDSMDGLYVLQRIDNGIAVRVTRNAHVKPTEIDRLGALAVKCKLSPRELDQLKTMEDEYLDFLKSTPPEYNFTVSPLKNFRWQQQLRGDYPKTDIINKNQPMSHCLKIE